MSHRRAQKSSEISEKTIEITIFDSQSGTRFSTIERSLAGLADLIKNTHADRKEDLPWLKLARFGETRSRNGSLRTNANMVSISGVEVDYDAGDIPPNRAADMFAEAGISALIFTTASHKQPGKGNRWRGLFPTSRDFDSSDREQFVARINGIAGGKIDPASFTQSQAFYYGNVEGGTPVKTYLIEGDCIDVAGRLDDRALGRDGKPYEKRRDRGANDNQEGPTRPQHVADSALMAIPNEGGRDRWRDIGAAHKSAGGSFAVFNKWSKLHESYDTRHTRQTWDSLDPAKEGGITERTLYYEASENGWRDLEEDAEILAAFDDKDYDWLEDIIAEENKAAPANSSLVMLTPDDCDVGSRSNYVIKGFLGAGEIGTVVGPPGVGKSALTASMGYAVAQGDETFSMRTCEGPVFYLACENETDMKRRVKALRDKRGRADNFRLVLGGAGNLVVGSKFHRALLKEIERQRPVLVVIDTLAAAMPGFEENSSEGMGKAIAMAKSLGKFGAAVIVVHHDTKAGDGLPRGHSSLNGIVDVNLALRREVDGLITGQCSKNRSGKSHEQIVAYENQVVELGIDQDGDAITTVICEETEVFPRTPKPLSEPNALALRILIDCMQGASSIPVSVWRNACMNDEWLQSYDNRATRRKTFDRAREGLQKLKRIALDGDDVRVIDPDRADMNRDEFDDEPDVVRRGSRRNREDLA